MPFSALNRWLAGTAFGLMIALALVLWQVRPTYDLAYFLPEPATEPEKVLVERLGQGAGARLVFIEVKAPPGGDAAGLAAALRARLAGSPLFLRVENGHRELAVDAIPAPLWRWRYLLVDTDWSESGPRAALKDRLGDLATLGGAELARLIASDPPWAAVRIAASLDLGGESPQWTDGPRRAFLVAETAAPPFEIAEQQAVLDLVRVEWASLAGGAGAVELYGVGVYGARVQWLIQRESQLLGLVATMAVLATVTLAYRSLRLTLLSMIPLATAVLGGLIASSLIFGRIHGITIAFGATLVGVVDDYPMHLFSHARHVTARDGVRLLLGTLLVSAGTTIVAYAVLALSGSRGLAQLGVFSLAGIACAMLATCLLLPRLMRQEPIAVRDDVPLEFRLSARVWLPLLAFAAAALVATDGVRWTDSLGDVTPLPPELLARDRAMRARFGAPDVRFLVSVGGGTAEEALAATETLGIALTGAREAGLVESWSAVTGLLPAVEAQERRRAAIPSPEDLRRRLAVASAGLPFRDDAFEPFLADAARARELPPLQAGDLAGGFTGEFVAGHLAEHGGRWRSVAFVVGIRSSERLAEWLAGRAPGAELVDLRAASESLVRGYRQRLMGMLALATVLIAGLVMAATRSPRRFAWSAGTVAASVAFTLAAVNWLDGQVSLFHMVSLVLVAGLGVDYCLFYSRPGMSRTDFLDARHAVLASAASTAGAFAILGASSIPLLASIGETVAIGTFTVFVVSRAGLEAVAHDYKAT